MTEDARINALIEQLDDFRTRSQARKELREIGKPAAEPLLDVVRNPELRPNHRWAALTLLADLQFEPAVPVLIEILREDLQLRGDAARALRTITGKDAGEDAEAWDQALRDEAEPEAETQEEMESERFALVKRALGADATEITWEEPGYAYLRLPLGEGRKQQVIVTFDAQDSTGQQVACVYTECGAATPNAQDTIYRRNVTLRYGTFVIEKDGSGGEKVVMRHYIALDALNEAVLHDCVMAMAAEADSLEYELTQADRI